MDNKLGIQGRVHALLLRAHARHEQHEPNPTLVEDLEAAYNYCTDIGLERQAIIAAYMLMTIYGQDGTKQSQHRLARRRLREYFTGTTLDPRLAHLALRLWLKRPPLLLIEPRHSFFSTGQ